MEFLKFLFFSVFFFLLLLKMVVLLWWRPRKIESHFFKQGIKGPPYRFFFGNVRELAGMMKTASSQPMPLSHNILPRVLPFFHHWSKIYNCTFLVWFGPNYRLAVSDPDIIREIFTSETNAEVYEKNEAHPLIKQLEGDGLLRLKGEKWAHHRKLISPTFHMGNLKRSMPVIAKSVVEMADKWSEMADSGEVEIDVSQWFQTLTEDVVTRTVFGSSYVDGKAIFKRQSQQMEIVSEALKKGHIPGYRFLPTRTNWKSWKLDREIKNSLSKLINHRRKDSSSDDKGSKDLLGLMIQASSSSVSSTITVNDIVEECKSFFFASKHTSSNLLTWTVVLMAMHPRWQDLARDEVVTVCGSHDTPSKDNIIKLKTLNMILNESLRLYPPIVATIRRARTDTKLGGYKIPRGTEILIPIIAVHHDHLIWGNDANEFNPGRFSKGAAHAAKHPVGFFPFGLGVRMCIGQNLAILQAKLALAMILQRFSFQLGPSYQHAPTVDMILFPQYGAPIIFRGLPDHRVVS